MRYFACLLPQLVPIGTSVVSCVQTGDSVALRVPVAATVMSFVIPAPRLGVRYMNSARPTLVLANVHVVAATRWATMGLSFAS